MEKDLKREFKKTKLGAKFYKRMIIWGLVWLVSILAECTCAMFNVKEYIIDIVGIFKYVLFVVSIYYEGKYRGAFEQFKTSKEITKSLKEEREN